MKGISRFVKNTETRAAPIPEYVVRLGFAPVLYFFQDPPEYNMKRLFAHFLLAAGAMLLSVASYGQVINSVPLHDHQARRPHRYLPAPII